MPEPPSDFDHRVGTVALATARATARPQAPGAQRRVSAEDVPAEAGTHYIPRAITIFMTSFDPPKMRVMRLSRYMRAIG